MKTVDTHQHFWHPARGDYGWLPEGDPILDRSYNPTDLAPHLRKTGVQSTILVQAAPTLEETEYLLGIADATDHVAGVIGWVDFENREHSAHLRRLAAHPKFLGVRPMIQNIPDDEWMFRPDIQWAYEAIIENDLVFEALGFPGHLANFRKLLTRYSDMRTVINHCMKPQIRNRTTDPDHFGFWADGMSRLAEETSAVCKFSGLITESDGGWDIDVLRPYAIHVIAAFGPQRMMWGSDWPVCRLEAEYDEWHAIAQKLTADLGKEAQARIFGGTAVEVYRI